jgi:hypothetical protein
MIMAMIHPVFQPLAVDAARLNGRRKTMRPTAKRKTPITRGSHVLARIVFNEDQAHDLLSNSTAMSLTVSTKVRPLLTVSAGMIPAFLALLRFILKTVNRGIAVNGAMIAKVPKAQRQLPTLSSKAWAALGPAKAVIIYGEEVKAKASPRFLRLVVSTATITYA